eukprot:XP_002937741.2 PREDICTED: diablo homolog, mitochondrial isoform X1 [Xenopus tropicalis]
MDAIGAGVELPRRKILRPKRFRDGGEQGELLLGTTRKRKMRYLLQEERDTKCPVQGRVGKVVRRNGATPQDCGRFPDDGRGGTEGGEEQGECAVSAAEQGRGFGGPRGGGIGRKKAATATNANHERVQRGGVRDLGSDQTTTGDAGRGTLGVSERWVKKSTATETEGGRECSTESGEELDEESNEGEWGMEADPVPRGGGCGQSWARGGCNTQLRGNGHPRYVQDALRPRYGGGLQGWEYNGYEDDFYEDAYCDGDYCEEGDGCSYDLRKVHRLWQRRPRWMDQQDNMYSHNFGCASFFFRNREEEESWRQWRKERMGQQMGDGSRIGNQQAATSSASHTVGEERNAGVYMQEAATELGSLDVLANQDSDSDTSDSETEGGKILALIKKYFKDGKGKEGDRKRGKKGGQLLLPLGAADTYACALTETAAHLPKKLRKSIETDKFVDVYELTREAVQAKEDGVKTEKEGELIQL